MINHNGKQILKKGIMYICITELLCYITKINNIVNEQHINKKIFFFCLIIKKKKMFTGTSLVVQWLRIWLTKAGEADSIPGWGTKIPHAREQLNPHAC